MSELIWLHPLEPTLFPELDQALEDPNGLLAAGGDLSLERLVTAYQKGIFPWYEEGQPILWWSPDPRTVLYPEHFILRRSLRKVIRNKHGPCILTAILMPSFVPALDRGLVVRAPGSQKI